MAPPYNPIRWRFCRAAVAAKVLAERTLAEGYISAVIAAPDEAEAIAAAKPYLDL